MQETLMELSNLLKKINEKKTTMQKLQKEVEIHIADLDKIMDQISKLKIEPPENLEDTTMKIVKP